ncbi:hypothetical protein ACQJBY_006526 [Aegilops geniculata]
MKARADKKRTDRSFVVGDVVFVKLQPYVQTMVARRTNHKLSFRYFGPFKITRIINPVAYELELPAGAKVHPVFHVSQLRRALSNNTTVEDKLPVPPEEPLSPVEIIDTRWRNTPQGRREQVLVRWSDPSILDATWEDAKSIRERFPALLAWGQASSQGGGDVSARTAKEFEGFTPRRVNSRPRRIAQPNRRFVGPEWAR